MTTTSSSCGWIAGWTLSAPPQELFQETSSPLSATLGTVPGRLVLASPGASFDLGIRCEGTVACRLSAAGFRMTISNQSHDAVASVIMLDPASLILEADADNVNSILSQPGFEQATDEAFYFSDEDEHRLGILVDINSSPMRVAAIAGTGDREMMRARARGLLSKSAHNLVDTHLNARLNRADLPPPDPREFIKSRIRAATGQIPYPWIADTDEEPIWNLALIYPVFRAFLDTEPDMATGLINNYFDLMKEDGSIPSAGGNIGQTIFATVSHPLLAGMCAVFHKRFGRLPADTGHTLSCLTEYLSRFISALDESNDPAVQDAIPLQLLQCELISLRYLARSTGRLTDKSVQSVIQTGSARFVCAEAAGKSESSPFLELINLSKHREEMNTAKFTAPTQITELISKNPGEQSAEWPCLTLIASDIYQAADYRAYSEWITETTGRLQTCWPEAAIIQDGSLRIDYRSDLLAFAAMLTNAEDQTDRAFDRSKLREQRLSQFIERNKKWILIAGLFLALALVVFLISVQMRQTMPISVYETNFGMVLQHYKAEQYDEAMNRIQEMGERGAGENAKLRFMKGKILYKQGDYAAAAEAFTFCIKNMPGNAAPYYNRALCFYRNGDFAEAIEQFELIEVQFRTIQPSIAAYARQARAIIEETENKMDINEDLQEKDEERGAPRRSG